MRYRDTPLVDVIPNPMIRVMNMLRRRLMFGVLHNLNTGLVINKKRGGKGDIVTELLEQITRPYNLAAHLRESSVLGLDAGQGTSGAIAIWIAAQMGVRVTGKQTR